MRALLQRVSEASVTIEGEVVGRIGHGLLVLLAIGEGDTDEDLTFITAKVPSLRIFEDEQGRMGRSLEDIGGGLLLVSQFTLYADLSRGRRPSFTGAMAPAPASELVTRAAAIWRAAGITVETGRFGADMKVALVNDGPVTLWLDSRNREPRSNP